MRGCGSRVGRCCVRAALVVDVGESLFDSVIELENQLFKQVVSKKRVRDISALRKEIKEKILTFYNEYKLGGTLFQTDLIKL